jgi:hypothetical protein
MLSEKLFFPVNCTLLRVRFWHKADIQKDFTVPTVCQEKKNEQAGKLFFLLISVLFL